MDLRQEIDQAIQSGAAATAVLRLAELWRLESGPAAAAFVTSRFEQLRNQVAFTPYRLAILRSFTVEPVVPLLRASAFCGGIDLAVHLGDFNAYALEILGPDSSLYRFEPDAVILAVRAAEVAPDLWQDFADLSLDQVSAACRRVCNSFQQWVAAFREHSRAALIVHSLEQPSELSFGVLDAQLERSQSAVIEHINRELADIVRKHFGVHLLDYDALVARHGRERWRDERKWLVARLPIGADQMIHVAREWLRFLVPLTGKTAKILVVDLDNTLWGGVIGEDGMDGLKLGQEYPGAAYQAVQRVMLDLSRRGILLAICSKNNPEDAMEALEKHPGMRLRSQDFSAIRINWNDKAQNLREIASELHLGLDAVAFLDDNPAEREHIRHALPEVSVIELPKDPLEYASALRSSPLFERLTLSPEDQQRTAYYAAQREISKAEPSFASKEDFYRFLEQQAEVAPMLPATVARISQLTQKTNQFNLTTRRYSEQQLLEMAEQPGHQILSIHLRDRFGDHGLVGVAVTRDQGETCEIDTFLLSCRVIGRTVETAFLSHIAQSAAARQRRFLTGWFLPTKKNAPAREFYQQHGFELKAEKDGGGLWALDIAQNQIACPAWIRLVVEK